MIPSDWEVCPLNFFADILNGDRGVNYPKASDFCDAGIPFINAGHLKKCQIDFSCMDYITYEHYKKLGGAKIKKNDILFCLRGSLGKYAYVNFDDAAPASSLCVLRSKKIDPKYLFQLLGFEYIKTQIIDANSGSSQPNLSAKDVGNFNVIFPPTIEEQQRIANALSDVDTLIANLEKLIAKKKNIKQGAMQQLLTGKIRLDDFSEKWIYVKIKDIFRVTRGYVLNSSLVSPFCDSCTPYPVFSSQTSNKGVMGYYRSYLYENAITWTTDGANAGDVNYRDGRFYCTNVCGVLLSDKGFANECIAGILSLCSKSYVSYVGNPKLMNNVMAEIEILIPPSLEEQTAIANVLSDMDTEISALETKLAKYRTLKPGMMQQL